MNEHHPLISHERFFNTPDPCFLDSILGQRMNGKLNLEKRKEIIISRKQTKKTKNQESDFITIESLVYRMVRKLNTASEQQVAKLFQLYEKTYIVEKVVANRISDVYTRSQAIINLDNLRIFKCTPEK